MVDPDVHHRDSNETEDDDIWNENPQVDTFHRKKQSKLGMESKRGHGIVRFHIRDGKNRNVGYETKTRCSELEKTGPRRLERDLPDKRTDQGKERTGIEYARTEGAVLGWRLAG